MTDTTLKQTDTAPIARPLQKRAGYHHGDLRDTLVKAAFDIVEAEGFEACTLKRASQMAGVSVAAPYRHFADKTQLLIAVAEMGFILLNKYTVEARDQYELGSIESLIAMGRGYVRFASEHAHLFRMMFGTKSLRMAAMEEAGLEEEAVERESEIGFTNFLETVAASLERVGGSAEDLMEMAMPLWSLVHGTASLVIDEGFEHMAPGTVPDQVIDFSTRNLYAGYKARLTKS